MKLKLVFILVGSLAIIISAYIIFTGAGSQHDPGIIEGVYYMESDKGKVIVINDVVTITVGGKGSLSNYNHSWLIELDAATGKEIKRTENSYLEYFGRSDGKFWMTTGDTTLKFHSRDPYTLEVVQDYKAVLEAAESANPVFKGKIAFWETNEYNGNLLITSYDAHKYFVSPMDFKCRDCTNDNDDSVTADGLPSVGLREQDPGYRMAYIGEHIYELDGRDNKKIIEIDKWHPTPTDSRGPTSEPYDISATHPIGNQEFIDGAFVYDAFTDEPLHFEGDSGMFVYHLDRLGAGGKNMLTHVDASGNVLTQIDITQTDPANVLLEAFVADGKLYLVFPSLLQCRDSKGKVLWEYVEDTMTHS